MPDNIIFTGEFDGSEISKGINGMIDALKRAQSQQDGLTTSMESTQETIDGSADGIKKLTAQIAALDKTSKDYAATNQNLNSRLTALQGQYDKYNSTIETQRKQLEASQVTVTKMTAAYDAATKSVTALQAETGKPIAPSMSDGKITATLATVKGKIKAAGADIASTLNDSTKPAIDNTADAVSSLGAVWGPVGIAAGVALGFIAKELYKMATAENDAERATRLLNESLQANVKASAGASDQVDIMKLKFELAREGLLNKKDVLDEYNSTLGKTLGVTKDFNEAEQTTIDNADTYIKIVGLKAQAVALSNIRIKASEQVAAADLGLADNRNTATKVATYLFKWGNDYVNQVKQDKKRFDSNIKIENEKIKDDVTRMEIDIQTQLAAIQTPFMDKPKELEKVKKARKEITNIYEQELQKLKSDIAKINEKGFTDEASITKSIEEDFKKRDLAFQKAFKNKQLTSGQLSALQDNLKNLQDLTLKKGLADFATQKANYLRGIDDQLTALQNDIDLKRIANIQDSFTRERLTIEAETDKTTAALAARRDKQIADLQKNAAKNGIGPAALQSQVRAVTDTYSDMLDAVIATRNQKLQKLSFDTFEKLSEDAKRLLNSGNLGVSQGALINIQGLAAQFQQGKISYAEYQKALTQIARAEANERFQIERQFLEAEIQVRQAKLASDKTLTDDQITKLRDEITTLQQRLADATRGNVTTGAADTKKDRDEKIQGLVNYANAIGQVIQSVVSFWQLANEAEQKSLARSIALQDRRVEAARNIAAKGNAEYLRLEEERQQALLIKQENAARRTLAINAAIQGSQVLVALVSAIAEGAKVGGAIGAILDVAAIVGAIASAYAIAQSLKPKQPSFFVGTEDTGHGGNVDGRGGFHAVLHPHERVLTAEENKKLRGLSNKEVIERVTENYLVKPAPSLNMAAMEQAVNSGTRSEVMRMEGVERELKLNNQLQLKTHRLLKSMGVSVNVDRNGLAVSVLEAADEIVKSKKI
jgi:hypothetical protein